MVSFYTVFFRQGPLMETVHFFFLSLILVRLNLIRTSPFPSLKYTNSNEVYLGSTWNTHRGQSSKHIQSMAKAFWWVYFTTQTETLIFPNVCFLFPSWTKNEDIDWNVYISAECFGFGDIVPPFQHSNHFCMMWMSMPNMKTQLKATKPPKLNLYCLLHSSGGWWLVKMRRMVDSNFK